jgi:hypothetical protein
VPEVSRLTMNVRLLKALAVLVPACLLVGWAAIRFCRSRTLPLFAQLFGAGCLVGVVLTHVCEALHLLPWMHWGDEHSVGHYLDLTSAVLGVTLFPLGYVFEVLRKRRA